MLRTFGNVTFGAQNALDFAPLLVDGLALAVLRVVEPSALGAQHITRFDQARESLQERHPLLIDVHLYLVLALVSRGFDANDRVVLEAIERKLKIDLGSIKRFI